MGPVVSTSQRHLIVDSDGGWSEFRERFVEAKNDRRRKHVLGEGQFGQVTQVTDTTTQVQYACKKLTKGIVLKDNIVYPPLKSQVLRGEVEILHTLQGHSFCLQLDSVYETPRRLLIVTELCKGGDMLEWVENLQEGEELRLVDVARVARQLYSAVNHCDQHGILHRDIKPANILFMGKTRESDLRLIDFGSACVDEKRQEQLLALGTFGDRTTYTTYVGTGFYIAPEVFLHNYNGLADVWSAAVSLYVLVASYPGTEELQRAFNLLQKDKRDLRQLPGHDDAMTETLQLNKTYFDFLSQALTYWPKNRPSAAELLDHPFLLQEMLDENNSQQQPTLASDQPLEFTSTIAALADVLMYQCNQFLPLNRIGSRSTNAEESPRHGSCFTTALDHLFAS